MCTEDKNEVVENALLKKLKSIQARYLGEDSSSTDRLAGVRLSCSVVDNTVLWTLSVGTQRSPKVFFHNLTLEAVMDQALSTCPEVYSDES
jgi:hypothetical protein